MRIAFDAKRITHNATGLGNYSRFVVNGLSEYYPTHTYHLYSPSPGQADLRERIVAHSHVSFHYPAKPAKWFSAYWRSYGMAKALRANAIDLYHGLSNEIPMNLRKHHIPSIVTIHDLIFLRYPQLYPPIDRLIYAHKFKRSCLCANHILAISRQTACDIQQFFHVPERKIEVVYQGCDPVFGQAIPADKCQEIRQKYAINEPYILYVGTIEGRKNLLLLAKALHGLKEDISVIAIGRRTPYANQVESYVKENGLAGRLRLLDNVPFGELPAFYAMATLFVYPSFFEGFGIPILEAQHAGVPVIAATGSCLEEAGGEGALYTDPTNEKELRSLIESVLHEPKLRDSMRENGWRHTRQFDPIVTSERLMRLYEQALSTS